MNDTQKSGYKGLDAFHKYWGKKPTDMWQSVIEELSSPGDTVMDPFLGSGLVARESIDLGRNFIGIDVNPISIELTKLYANPPKAENVAKAFKAIGKEIEPLVEELYKLKNGNLISHVLWNENVVEGVWVKNGGRREAIQLTKKEIADLRSKREFKSKHMREPRFFENARINSKATMDIHDLFSDRALRIIDFLLEKASKEKDEGIQRAIKLTISAAMGQMSNMVFAVTNKGKVSGKKGSDTQIGSWVIGYWRPGQHFEINAWNCFSNKASKLVKGLKEAEEIIREHESKLGKYSLYLSDSESQLKKLKPGTVQLVVTDPPHGDRIPYLELSEMWNSVLNMSSNFDSELVVSNAKVRNKGNAEYTDKFKSILKECGRVLKDEGFLAVIFNSANSDHWKALTELESKDGFKFLGRFDMNYSAGSVVQDNRAGGLKKDYVLVYAKNVTPALTKRFRARLSKYQGWSVELPEVVNEP
jgi:DNA modification methylase